jgi:type IV secretory pathway VirB3-like protein
MNHRIIAQYMLASVVIVGFFCVLSLMLLRDKNGADILVGGLAAAFGSVVGYFYGSSASSARKDELIAGRP